MVNDNDIEPSSTKQGEAIITPQQIDAIGEILNISMGSAATAVSTLLDRQVSITTPKVSVRQFQKVDLKAWEPAMMVRIKYIEGISGTNMMVFHKTDVQMIINLLMGIDTPPSEDFEFDELSMSAACEVMNQMMGSSATAMSSFFDKRIDISTPEAHIMETEEEFRELIGIDKEEDIVSISFQMTIPGILDSEFINIMQIDLARNLAMQALGEDSAPPPPPVVVPQPQPVYEQPSAPPPPPPQQQQQQQQPMYQQPQASYQQSPPPAYEQQQQQQPMYEQQQPQQPMYQQPQQQQQQQQPMYQQPQQPMYQQPPQVYQSPAIQATPPVQVRTPQFPDFSSRTDSSGMILNSNMDLMMGLPLTVSVEIGKTSKKIKDIMDFTQGTVIELEKQAGAPVDIVVNGHLIARGDVVVIDDNFGVRITEIIRTKDLDFS